ncbi:MAG: acylphosphatase [Thermoplasmataceae archaeon]
MKIARRVLFYGQVQGVNFRRNVAELAARNGITGWVRNLEDGSVEAHMEGDQEKVQITIQMCCTELFPARVEKYHSYEDAMEDMREFRVIR